MVFCHLCKQKIGFFDKKYDFSDGKNNLKICMVCKQKMIEKKQKNEILIEKIEPDTKKRLEYVLYNHIFLDENKLELPPDNNSDFCWICQKNTGKWFKGFRKICTDCQNVIKSSNKFEIEHLIDKNNQNKRFYFKLWEIRQKIEEKRVNHLKEENVALKKYGYSLMTQKQIDSLEENHKISKNLKLFKCNDCEYVWESRKKYGSPSKCPHCNSKNITNN